MRLKELSPFTGKRRASGVKIRDNRVFLNAFKRLLPAERAALLLLYFKFNFARLLRQVFINALPEPFDFGQKRPPQAAEK